MASKRAFDDFAADQLVPRYPTDIEGLGIPMASAPHSSLSDPQPSRWKVRDYLTRQAISSTFTSVRTHSTRFIWTVTASTSDRWLGTNLRESWVTPQRLIHSVKRRAVDITPPPSPTPTSRAKPRSSHRITPLSLSTPNYPPHIPGEYPLPSPQQYEASLPPSPPSTESNRSISTPIQGNPPGQLEHKDTYVSSTKEKYVGPQQYTSHNIEMADTPSPNADATSTLLNTSPNTLHEYYDSVAARFDRARTNDRTRMRQPALSNDLTHSTATRPAVGLQRSPKSPKQTRPESPKTYPQSQNRSSSTSFSATQRRSLRPEDNDAPGTSMVVEQKYKSPERHGSYGASKIPRSKPNFNHLFNDIEVELPTSVEKEDLGRKIKEKRERREKERQEKLQKLRQLEEAQREEARRRAEEEERKKQEEARLLAEAKRQEEERKRREEEARIEAERLEEEAKAKAQAKAIVDIVVEPSEEWMERIQNELYEPETLRSSDPAAQQLISDVGATTRRDLRSLLPGTWLNDEAINAYLKHICDRANANVNFNPKANLPTPFYAFNTNWFNTIRSGTSSDGQPIYNFAGVARWTRRPKLQNGGLLKSQQLLFPINLRNHWTLLVIYPHARRIEYLDSFYGDASRFFDAARFWLQNELKDKYVESEWEYVKDMSPRQNNGYDCGVFVCFNAVARIRGFEPTEVFSGEELDMGRMQIAGTLMNGGIKGEFEWKAG